MVRELLTYEVRNTRLGYSYQADQPSRRKTLPGINWVNLKCTNWTTEKVKEDVQNDPIYPWHNFHPARPAGQPKQIDVFGSSWVNEFRIAQKLLETREILHLHTEP